MTPQERQQALDNISLEELDEIKAHQAKLDGGYKVDDEWLILTEFAMTFGWEAYKDTKRDVTDGGIGLPEMMTLIEASRKIKNAELYQSSFASFIGAVSAASKKPSKIFMALTKSIVKKTKTD